MRVLARSWCECSLKSGRWVGGLASDRLAPGLGPKERPAEEGGKEKRREKGERIGEFEEVFGRFGVEMVGWGYVLGWLLLDWFLVELPKRLGLHPAGSRQ